MNASRAQTDTLITGLRNAGELTCDLAVFPPFPYLSQAISLADGSQVGVGAQNCAEADSGAYTGEVSAEMLTDLGASMVIIGHSERRTLYGETDDVVLRKTRQALDSGLIAVVCVGETLDERQSGKAEEVVGTQMSLLISELSDTDWKNVVIAYEPVWAIGTGETATPEQAQAIHAFIRGLLNQRNTDLGAATRLLYGGSVKAANAAELFSQQDIDGGLVGGASLDVDEFLGICRA